MTGNKAEERLAADTTEAAAVALSESSSTAPTTPTLAPAEATASPTPAAAPAEAAASPAPVVTPAEDTASPTPEAAPEEATASPAPTAAPEEATAPTTPTLAPAEATALPTPVVTPAEAPASPTPAVTPAALDPAVTTAAVPAPPSPPPEGESAETADEPDDADLGDDDDDADSAVGNMSYSSLASLTDSIREFRHENGRTYHSLSAGKYWCPNDDPENSRLDIQHHAHRLTFDGALCLCPKAEGARRVLDLGTGTGIWSMEYADEHPDTEVIGVDLSPIQPEFVPPNCTFEVDDVEKMWTWSRPFDFIWWRALLGCFTDVEAMVQKCYDNLEPGGYLEMHDGTFPPQCDDGTMPPDCALVTLTKIAAEASAALGRPIDRSPQYRDIMERVGFVDLVFVRYDWPINPWPTEKKMKTLGYWTYANVEPGLEGIFLALLTRGKGMSVEETLMLCAEARKDLRNQNMHGYWTAYCCYGRKPE